MAQKVSKAKYWVCVLYPESMREDWKDVISDLVQVPYAYCIHDKDKDGHDGDRKVHVHLLLAFPNTTTLNHAKKCFQLLYADKDSECKYCEQVMNIRYMYNYLIHDTESCKKNHKHLYDISERIEGNNFDIGAYEQITLKEKRMMLKELCDFIVGYHIYNFSDFYLCLLENFTDEYFDVLSAYSGLLERLCKGEYLRLKSSGQIN